MQDFKRLIKTLLIFILCVAILSVPVTELYLHSEYCVESDLSARDELAGKIDLIFCGGSQMAYGIDCVVIDAALGSFSYDLSGTWQTLGGSRLLLSHELSRNPVKRVVIGVALDTLIREDGDDLGQGDYLILPRLSGIGDRVRYLFGEVTPSEAVTVYYELMHRGAEYILTRLKGGNTDFVDEEAKGQLRFEGKSVALTGKQAASRHKKTQLDTGFLQENIDALSALIDLCREAGAEPVLAVMPVSDAFNWSHIGLEELHEELAGIAEEKETAFFDLNLLSSRYDILDDESSYTDEEHLDAEGAEALSAELARLLEALDEDGDISGFFFGDYAAMEEASPYNED